MVLHRMIAVLAGLAVFSTSAAGATEGLVLNWPDEEGWKVANRQENKQVQMVEIVRGGETLENWTQLGTMIWNKGVVLPSIDKAYSVYADKLKASCPDARFNTALVENDVPFPRMIFSVECPKTPKDGHPESTVWLIVQGKQSLYVVHRATKSAALPENLRKEWVSWLKTAKVVQQ